MERRHIEPRGLPLFTASLFLVDILYKHTSNFQLPSHTFWWKGRGNLGASSGVEHKHKQHIVIVFAQACNAVWRPRGFHSC